MKHFLLPLCLLLTSCFTVGAADINVTPATLEKVHDLIRQARKEKPDEAITVHLAPGRYFLDKSLELTKKDSGTESAPVVFRSEKPFGAELIGGVEVPGTAFKKVDDAEILGRLDKTVHGKVLVADLNELGIPAMKEWGPNFRGRPTSPPELFFNDEPMTVARWPNDDWTGFKTALDSGMPHNEETAEVNKKRAEKANVTFTHTEVDTAKRHGGTFLYDEDGLRTRDAERFARWRVEDGIWLCGYWTHDWSDEVLRVASIDTKQKILTLEGVHGYGIGGKSWTGYKERRYFVQNLLEELDAPGEWYLDRKTNKLYFYPPADVPGELKDASIVLSTLERPLVSFNDASHIRFEGVSFGPVFFGAVNIRNGEKISILGCRIRNTANHGVSINGGKDHTVRSCDLYNIGSVGVSIYGGDRKKLVPSHHLAENNHVHHFGRLQRTYAGAFSLNGVGNTLRNNRMHDAPHLAISYGGNENRIERNEIYNVVQETSDAGALYTGRDWTTQGNVIEENFIHHLGTSDSHGTMGVYLDDCDCGDTIRRNVFYKASRAVFIGGGRDNIVVNNLFIECYQGIALDSRGMTWPNWNKPNDSWHLEGRAEALDYKSPPWSERYPKLARIMDNNPQMPLGCVFSDNVMIDCRQWISLDGKVREVLARTDLEDNIVVANNLVVTNNGKLHDAKLAEKELSAQKFIENVESGFVDVEKLDFHLKPDSPLRKMLPKKFEPIPMKKIGVYTDEFRKTL